jgi:hypothetical protein
MRNGSSPAAAKSQSAINSSRCKSIQTPGQPASCRIVQQTPTVYNRRHQNAGWLNPVYQAITVDKAFAYIGLIQFGDDAARLRKLV